MLLAACAVPAFAAPEGWSDLGSGFVAAQAAQPGAPGQAMPFETAGASFPGSAFYYLADEAAPPLAPQAHSDAEPAPSWPQVALRVPALPPPTAVHPAAGQLVASKDSMTCDEVAQDPATHTLPAAHARPHAPQCCALVWVLTSQPLA